ncbi:hypothetical protein [Winogradskyella flava]|uniref:hypothetical protein n=1 Tax=Winogradskyella flava TaxID=1884876 RepID=UPI002492734E|nr:hypothetical protein [Winogradskyella flava]
MKKIVLITFALVLGLNVFGQRRRNMNGVPQTNREPTELEIAKRKQMMEDRKQEYIDNFLTTLEADEFQKVIIKQYIDSYYDKKIALLKERYEHSLDRKDAIEKLDNSHFKELEALISENDMAKIKEMIKGNFDEKEVVKKKKKKRKKRKKDKDEDDDGR